MKHRKVQSIHDFPHLDPRTALEVINILDTVIATLWAIYGDCIIELLSDLTISSNTSSVPLANNFDYF
jgi:hypothetical protein